MEQSSDMLPVSAIPLENGVVFHAKVIGLDRFLLPAKQALENGFLLGPTSKN